MSQNSISIEESSNRAMSNARIALVDMDETLCDYSTAVAVGLSKLRSPQDDPAEETMPSPPPHIVARRKSITSAPGFWRDLQPVALGFQVLHALAEMRFEIHIVTKGPSDQPLAWMEKVQWCKQHVPELPLVITENKALIWGHVLVEDWPPYIARWLDRFIHGFVIVPARPWNSEAESDFMGRCIRYDGTNLDAIFRRLR